MRVQLAVTALALSSMVSAKRLSSSSNRQEATQIHRQQAVATTLRKNRSWSGPTSMMQTVVSSMEPIWKAHARQLKSSVKDDPKDTSEPDVGILSRRNLQWEDVLASFNITDVDELVNNIDTSELDDLLGINTTAYVKDILTGLNGTGLEDLLLGKNTTGFEQYLDALNITLDDVMSYFEGYNGTSTLDYLLGLLNMTSIEDVLDLVNMTQVQDVINTLNGTDVEGILDDITNSTDIAAYLNVCELLETYWNTTSCDCSNWDILTGTFTCDLYGGEPNCTSDGVCAAMSFKVAAAAAGNMTIEYCADMTSPEQHTYCTEFLVSANGLMAEGSEDLISSALSCSLKVDGTTCESCMIQSDCNTDGVVATAPGSFDCSNTAAGTSGNQCNGDSPFPIMASESRSPVGDSSAAWAPGMLGCMVSSILIGTVALL